MPTKGYKYESYTKKQVLGFKASGDTKRGGTVDWGHRISEGRKKLPVSEMITGYWAARPRKWVITDIHTQEVFRTDNLKTWCEARGHTDSHLNRISKYHAGGILSGSRYYRKKFDCWNEETKKDVEVTY